MTWGAMGDGMSYVGELTCVDCIECGVLRSGCLNTSRTRNLGSQFAFLNHSIWCLDKVFVIQHVLVVIL